MKFFILAWTKKLRNWHHWKERLKIRKPRKCAWKRRIRFLFKHMFFFRDYCKAVSISSLGFVNTPFNPFTAKVFDGVL